MANVVKRVQVDLDATFSKMAIGDKVKINTTEASEGNVRTKASRYNQKHNIRLVVSVLAGTVSVVRQS